MKKVCALIGKYFGVLAVIFLIIGMTLPTSFSWVLGKVGGVSVLSVLLGIIMFGMGMTMSVHDFALVLKRPKDVFFGACAQYLVMPFLAYVLSTLFHLNPALTVGVVLVGTCPGGTSSNVMTYLARGDVALSVSMTMTTTILAPVVTPLLTWWLAGAWVDISLSAMMMSIVKVVIVPIVGGILVNSLFGNVVQKYVKLLPLISVVAIVLIVGGVVAVSSQRIMETGALIMLVVMLHNLLGYALGFGIAKALRMDIAKVKAISIEVGMQNSGLATSLAMMHFGAAAAIPGAIFSVWHNISGSLAANYLSSRMTKEKEEEPATEA